MGHHFHRLLALRGAAKTAVGRHSLWSMVALFLKGVGVVFNEWRGSDLVQLAGCSTPSSAKWSGGGRKELREGVTRGAASVIMLEALTAAPVVVSGTILMAGEAACSGGSGGVGHPGVW